MELVQKKRRYGNWQSTIKGTDILHCPDGPAEKDECTEAYYLWGLQHRIDGPAYKDSYSETYYLAGMQHCSTGPAISSYGSKSYYLFGECMSKRKFEKLMADKAFAAEVKRMEKGLDELLKGTSTSVAAKPGSGKDKQAKEKSATDNLFPIFAAIGLGAGGLAIAGRQMKLKAAVNKEAKVGAK